MRKKTYSKNKEVRRMARERVGNVPPAHPIQPLTRKRPKHKKEPLAQEEL